MNYKNVIVDPESLKKLQEEHSIVLQAFEKIFENYPNWYFWIDHTSFTIILYFSKYKNFSRENAFSIFSDDVSDQYYNKMKLNSKKMVNSLYTMILSRIRAILNS